MENIRVAYARHFIKKADLEELDGWTVVKSNANFRVRYRTHSIDWEVLIEEKPLRGKRTYRTYYLWCHRNAGKWFMPENLMLLADAMKQCFSYSDAVDALDLAREAAITNTMEDNGLKPEDKVNIYLPGKGVEGKKPSVEFQPDNTNPLHIRGRDFILFSSWDSFKVHAPGSDLSSHDPSYTGYRSNSKASARKLYNALALNPDQLHNWTYNDLPKFFDRLKVKYEYMFSSWR